MNKAGKKSYWDSSKSQPSARNARECNVTDFEIDVNANTGYQNRMQVMNEINPQVYTGMAQNLNANMMTNAGISSSIPFNQSQFLMYGALFAGINRRVLTRINGQGTDVIGPNSFLPDAPGGLNFKIPIGQFYVHLAPAIQSPKVRYLMAPQNIADTGGNDLAINGLAGRIIVLVCGETVTFTVDPKLANTSSQNVRQIGVYFSSFPVGGTNQTAVNSMDSTEKPCSATINTASTDCCCEETALPGLLAGTTAYFPGTTHLVTPTANWGFLVYLCCTAGFSMYCPVIVVTLAQTC